ncbi:MAG: hypothetical protein D6805_09405 [Planctomycetota bacterium]|nr:MAG: hypothetical protein D6805_09405 [Planctomycetota bacterium]
MFFGRGSRSLVRLGGWGLFFFIFSCSSSPEVPKSTKPERLPVGPYCKSALEVLKKDLDKAIKKKEYADISRYFGEFLRRASKLKDRYAPKKVLEEAKTREEYDTFVDAYLVQVRHFQKVALAGKEAAERKKWGEVRKFYSQLRQSCNSCHLVYDGPEFELDLGEEE